MATTNMEMDPREWTMNATKWFVMLAEAGLALRVLFALFGAQAGSSGFVRWLYENTETLLSPFRNIFHTSTSSQFVLDFVALFAMVAYFVFGLLVMHWANSWKTNR